MQWFTVIDKDSELQVATETLPKIKVELTGG